MDPALLQQILGAGPLAEQQGQIDQQLQDVIARRRAYQPTQRTSGIGSLLGGLGDIIMGNKFNEGEQQLRTQRDELAGKMAGLRGQYAQALTGAPAGVAPEQQSRLGTLGMLTGDPLIGGVGKMLADPKHQLEMEQLQKTQDARQAMSSPAGATLLRAVASKFAPGVDVSNAPPEVLNQLMGTLEKGFGASESAAARREAAQQSAELRRIMLNLQNQRFEQTTATREDQFKAKRTKEMTDALNPFVRKGGLANYTQGINRAQKLDALLVDPATGEPKKLLTPQDMVETAIALQQLVAAGHASQSEVEQLIPKSVGGDAAKALQYFTGEPWNAGQQKWALRMLHTAHREADVNRGSILQALKQQLPQFSDLRSKYQPDYESILKGAGINPAAFNEQGLPVEGMDMSLGTNAVLDGAARSGGGHAARKFTRGPDGKLVEVK